MIIHAWWPDPLRATPLPPVQPDKPRRNRSKEPKPFAGYIQKPLCEACEHGVETRLKAPGSPPPLIIFNRGRKRTVDTSGHFCPDPDCSYHGWLGLGNIRANGHPGGQPWRQFQCVSCQGYFYETHGTIFHGKRSSPDLIVHVIACLAEGLGIRGTARVFEIDPNTVLQWLVEAAEQLQAFSAYFLHDVHLNQIQLDELYAVLSAVRDGNLSEDEAIEHLSTSPLWVWTAIDPESKLMLSALVGERSQAMAQAVLHQIAQLLAPGRWPAARRLPAEFTGPLWCRRGVKTTPIAVPNAAGESGWGLTRVIRGLRFSEAGAKIAFGILIRSHFEILLLHAHYLSQDVTPILGTAPRQ